MKKKRKKKGERNKIRRSAFAKGKKSISLLSAPSAAAFYSFLSDSFRKKQGFTAPFSPAATVSI